MSGTTKMRMMAIVLVAIHFVILTFPRPVRAASVGVVAKRISGCDYFLVNARSGYSVLEWYGGHDPDADDELIGKFETYGMHEIVDETADETLTVWTEEYSTSRAHALEVLVDKCGS